MNACHLKIQHTKNKLSRSVFSVVVIKAYINPGHHHYGIEVATAN